MRHFGQKPSVRPGPPCRERPTGAPQAGQNRRSSGTSGLTISARSGSITGIDGTLVSPAPSRAPRSLVDPVDVLRVVRDPGAIRCEPIGAVAIRFDDEVAPERVDDVPARADSAPTGCPDPVAGTGAAGAAPAGEPQTSQ